MNGGKLEQGLLSSRPCSVIYSIPTPWVGLFFYISLSSIPPEATKRLVPPSWNRILHLFYKISPHPLLPSYRILLFCSLTSFLSLFKAFMDFNNVVFSFKDLDIFFMKIYHFKFELWKLNVTTSIEFESENIEDIQFCIFLNILKNIKLSKSFLVLNWFYKWALFWMSKYVFTGS